MRAATLWIAWIWAGAFFLALINGSVEPHRALLAVGFWIWAWSEK